MQFILGSTRRMNPVARIALMLVGATLFCAFLLLGAIALAVLVGVGAIALVVRRLTHRHASGDTSTSRGHDPRVLEGTCVVLDKSSQH